MAHQLRYYKEIESQGHTWRVDFYQDTDETVEVQVIGPVLQGLRLVMQGNQADIDTPIVKTSLEMTFIDAPDLEGEGKTGYWEEFYTSSATEWMVKLWKDGVIEWSGFVTPDSFSEDLRYRGSVSIIARDNLGTMQDVAFDLDYVDSHGKIYIYHIFNNAFKASNCVMDLIYDEAEAFFPRSVNMGNLVDYFNRLSYINVDYSSFKDLSWWDVLTKILSSTGLVMRYVGKNKIIITTLRDMPKSGKEYWWEVEKKDVNFISHGNRELMYGIKDIVEVQEFDKIEREDKNYSLSNYTDNESTYPLYNVSFRDPDWYLYTDMVVPTHGYSHPQMGGEVSAVNSQLLNISKYKVLEGESNQYGSWDATDVVYMGINLGVAGEDYIVDENRPFQIDIPTYSSGDTISFNAIFDKGVALTPDGSSVMNIPANGGREYSQYLMVKYLIKHTLGSTILYFSNGSWSSAKSYNYLNYDSTFLTVPNPPPRELNISNIPSPGRGIISLQIVNLFCDPFYINVSKACKGYYLRLRNIAATLSISEGDRMKVIEKFTYHTKYSDKYSVRISRDVDYAINSSDTPSIALLENAMLTRINTGQYKGSSQWFWARNYPEKNYEDATGVPLTQLIHQQILAYYAKPNNILSGELMDAGGRVPDFSSLWMWNGKEHMLMSGSLNILTGRMESAVLREFTRYEHMWETWVENDYVEVNAPMRYTNFSYHSSKTVTKEDIHNLPEWISVSTITSSIVQLKIYRNETGEEREAIIYIDSAPVKIIQSA